MARAATPYISVLPTTAPEQPTAQLTHTPIRTLIAHFLAAPHATHTFLHEHGWQRARLATLLESKWSHLTILCLIILDVLIILVEMIITMAEAAHHQGCQQVEDEHEGHDGEEAEEGHEASPHANGVEVAEEVLGWVTVGILCVFIIEIVLKLVVFGVKYFSTFLHLFDAAIVVTSLVLSVVFSVAVDKTAGQVIGLLVLLRLWRVVRLIDSILVASSIHHEQHITILKERIKLLEEKDFSGGHQELKELGV